MIGGPHPVSRAKSRAEGTGTYPVRTSTLPSMRAPCLAKPTPRMSTRIGRARSAGAGFPGDEGILPLHTQRDVCEEAVWVHHLGNREMRRSVAADGLGEPAHGLGEGAEVGAEEGLGAVAQGVLGVRVHV